MSGGRVTWHCRIMNRRIAGLTPPFASMTKTICFLILIFLFQFTGRTAPAQTSVPKDTVITLHRFPDAFENGTRYNLTINADGSVALKRFKSLTKNFDPDAPESQTFQTKIPLERVAELVAAFDRINYFSLNDSYVKTEDGCPGVIIDQGGVEISITLNGKTKTIAHYFGCRQTLFDAIYPRQLTELELKIDDVAGTKQWLKQ